MDTAPICSPAIARYIFPALLGFVTGTALQLHQETLHPGWIYGLLMLLIALALVIATVKPITHGWRLALACGLLAFGVTGLRSSIYAQAALDAGLEGRDLLVTGIVAAMPQHNETGLRILF
jgi:competence protein ComEC